MKQIRRLQSSRARPRRRYLLAYKGMENTLSRRYRRSNDTEERPEGTLRMIIRSRSKSDPLSIKRLACTSKRTRDLVAE